ncbi:SWI/SNF-related matrix-associated actin-dependent regulator of chromatin subfamily A containing DEAD/H box 1-like isoform X2 [Schistocerca gregaria]|uniref:SWI/SNF-related matrix-associated actin-dependent regulator of chromatin subfamily A containing DEAD/H box 1-like isoform X2 n=1 Tax=Schistocerca gregaria TaxID=7010 RepID=UPI00211F2FBD|nr:SWI/SNF-related matrix-associated actin-dependent regulator of chromatin subfamily A containing DEAD/H box 1-like isoform X2 [Schistocerca gregaria]
MQNGARGQHSELSNDQGVHCPLSLGSEEVVPILIEAEGCDAEIQELAACEPYVKCSKRGSGEVEGTDGDFLLNFDEYDNGTDVQKSVHSRLKRLRRRQTDEDDSDSNGVGDVGTISEDEEESMQGNSEFDKVLKQCSRYSRRLDRLLSSKLQSGENALEGQPKALKRQLKDYQVAGVNWLYTLHNEGLGCILADEMGLGKTVQTISLLTLLKEKGHLFSHIIIVPASTISNWMREFSNWSDSLKVLMYYGTKNERYDLRMNILVHDAKYKKKQVDKEYPFDVLITTFQTASGKSDYKFLRKLNFHYLIVDEAQMLKGKDTSRYAYLFRINSQRRLLITGTPLQNNLNELSALLRFIMPDLFSSLHSSKLSQEVKVIMNDWKDVSECEYVHSMKRILKPFILRRLKNEIGLGLEPKKHKLVKIKMPPVQHKLYTECFASTELSLKQCGYNNAVAERGQGEVEEVLPNTDSPETGAPRASGAGFMNNMLMQLRKVSNHPILVRTFYSDEAIETLARYAQRSDPSLFKLCIDEIVNDFTFLSDFELHKLSLKSPALRKYSLTRNQLFKSSGKLLVLAKLLPTLKEQGHRVIIFSQFTTVLDILELFLTQYLDMRYVRLDGTTPINERQSVIDLYNTETESYFIFLLTTLAGGLGINLTSADTVIFHDISYNPQVDRQAEDRCHRLGQTKQVTIYILVAVSTVEEHMYNMAIRKTELNDLVLNEGKFAEDEVGDKESPALMQNLVKAMFDTSRQTQAPTAEANDDVDFDIIDITKS